MLKRKHANTRDQAEFDDARGRPEPDEAPLDDAPEPQPERREANVDDPGLTDLSKRDYVAILVRALKKANRDHVTNLAAALAYYAFLAVPSVLLIALGLFGLLASPHDVTTVIDKVGTIVPGQAKDLLESSLTRMTKKQSTGATIIGFGGLLALWSLGGAMQNLMWALNSAYDRDETRGFVRRRLTAFGMVFFALFAFALLFGVLVLGPQLSGWIGSAIGAK